MRVLEPRVLLDAAAVETAQQIVEQSYENGISDGAEDALADSGNPEALIDSLPNDLSRDIVFIDGNIDNIGELLGELDPDVEVHILDLDGDGVEQIADILDGREDVLAVHIFSHGGQGFLNLGSAQLSIESMSSTHADALSRIGEALGEDGDILVYGCDFASGDVGKVAAEHLARATGADIAASNDLTGSAELGGDWDLEVVEGQVEAETVEATGFKGVLGAFELGTVDAPGVTYVNGFTPATATGFGQVGEAGTVAIWENAGSVDTGTEIVNVDVRATVTSVSDADEIFVGFGTRDDDSGDNDDPTLDDFRVYIYNSSAVAGGSNTGNIGNAVIVWEIFKTGTNQTEVADIGEVSLTTADIDGVGAGSVTTRETLAASLSDLSSYTVQAGTNLEISNDGTNLRATGTADQDSEETSWVQYSWNSINQLTMIYETRTPYAYYNHDGDGDLVFTNPETAFATGIDLDADDSSGATGSNYQAIFYSNATSGTPVAIADGDISVTNEAGRATSATITLTNTQFGDQMNVDNSVLASLGLIGTAATGGSGEIIVTLSGNASATDYQTAIQSITYENTDYGSIDPTPRSIDIQVFDGGFASGVANTAITFGTIINQPTANHDVYVGQEDTALNVTSANSLLSNDNDPNGAALAVLSATDSNGAAIVVNSVGAVSPVSHTLPTGAVLTLFSDGTFDYVPAADYSGVEFFNYTVENVNGFIGQSYASINIQGVADTPNVPTGLISAAADEDTTSASLDLTATQGDADGSESLRYGVSQIPNGYSITDGVRSFTSTGLSDIAYLDGWDLTTISLVPPSPDQHSDVDVVAQLTVEVSEPNGSTTSASEAVTFRFDAVADAPTLTLIDGKSGPGALMNISPLVSATLVDIDGSEEIISYSFSNIPVGATFYVGAVAQTPSGGVVTIAATDLAALRLETPVALGAYSVDVVAIASETNPENQVGQATANSTTETLNFTVDDSNELVTAVNDTYTVFGGQSVTLNPLGNDSVPDGGAQISEINGVAIAVGETRALPGGLGDVTRMADGTLTFVAASSLSGQNTFTYTVIDVDGSTGTATITIDAPTWSIVGDASVGEGSSGTYTITLDAVPPMGTPVSVDISAIDIDTDSADYGDLAAAVQLAADASPYFSFDGTTLTYVADYDSTSLSGSNFQDISSEPSAIALGIGLFDPTLVSLGFDFDFYGETYNDLYVSDFGILTFDGPSPATAAAWDNVSFAGGNTLDGLPAIAPFWDVLGLNWTNSDDVYTLTQGLPGEREFIVQFNDVVNYYTDDASETITFQVVLREGSNEIEFRYDDVTLTSGTYSLGASATIGVSDGTGARFEEFSFNTDSLSNNSRVVFSADNNSASKSLSFSLAAISDSTFENSEDFSLQLSNAGESSVSATAGAATTSITDVNAAPVNTVPVTSGSAIAATTIAEDTLLTFNATNGNAIQVDDPDGDSITVMLSVANGVLTAATGSGATLSGDGSAGLTISGTQAEVNAALDGLSYQGIGDFNGTDLLTISTDDNGGQANSITVSTVDLEVTAVDDIVSNNAPIITGNSVIIDVLANDSFEGIITNVSAIDGAKGTVVVNGDNTLTYTWTDAAGSGLDSFTYTVTSGGVTETTDVVIIKQAPSVPGDDSNSTDEDTVLTVAAGGVLGNDYGSSPAPSVDYSIIDVSGAPSGSWTGGTTNDGLSWTGGITHNTSPTTSYPGISESLTFDGSGGATGASMQNFNGNPSDADASFEIWFKYDPADYASGQGAILYETGATTDGMSIALSDSTGSGSGAIDHLLVQFNDSGNTVVLLTSLEDVLGAGNIPNEFINVTAVYDQDSSGSSDEVRVYVNGVLLASQSTTGLDDWAGGNGSGLGTAANSPNIGNANFGNFTGEIAKLSLTESALSETEVKSRFDSVAGLTVISHDATSALGASVVVDADGGYSYDPTSAAALQAMQAGDSLADSFTYTIRDANGGESTATVNLTVAGLNDAPSGSDISVTISEEADHVLTVANFGFDDPVDGTNDTFQSVYFTTIPVDGDLVYDDGVASPSTVTAGQTITTADIAIGFLSFVPDVDANNTTTAGADYASFQFQVIDDGGVVGGGVDTDQSPNTFTFSVTPVDDVVSHILPLAQTAVEDTALSIGGVSVVDVDGDTITTIVTIPGANGTLSVATGTGATLSGNNSDSIILTGTAAQINGALAGLTYAPSADFNTDAAGPFNMSILSDDGGGGGPTFNTLAINVSGVADIVADSVTTDEDTAITFDAIGGTNGANGDNFEDVAAAVSAVSTASNGSVSINGFGEIVYTPDADFNGSDSFTYTVSAGGVSETALVTVTIDPVNDAPDLMADTASGAEDGGAINGNVLTNDSDIDVGDTLTVTQFAIVGIAGPHMANDTVNLPGVGTITLNDDGSFAFLPAADYNGTVPQITYTATDGTAPLSSTLDITVTPVNDNPVAAADSNSTDEDTPLSVNAASGVLSNDNDGDGAAPGVGLSVTQFTVDGMSYVAGNTANLAEGNLTLNPDGSYDFTPAANYNGAVPQITYTVTDVGGPGAGGAGGPLTHTATLDLTVNPINDAPDVTGPAGTVDATEDSGLFFTVAGGNGIVIGDVDTLVTDPGTTSVTLSVDHGTLLVAAGSGASVSDDGTKTVVIGGTLAQINAALDGLRYRGVDDYFGGDLISIDVDDGSATANATTSGSVMVNVQAVVDVEDDGVSTDEDTAVGFNVLTGFTLGDPDGATADDFESSSPRLAAIGTGADAPQNGTVSISDDGSVVYTPDANFNGLDSFTYMIETPDGDGGFVTETGTVTVTVNAINDGPEHTVPDTSGGPLASTTTTEDGSITFAAANGNGLSVADVDGPGLTTTLSVTHGTLAVAAGSGASVSDDGTGTVTLSGTSAQINAALEGLVYTPLDDFNTGGSQSEQLVMSTNDGSGAANAIVSDTIDIAVTAIGDVASDSISTNEDTAASFNVLTGLGGASADNFEDAGRVVTSVTQGTHGSVGFDGAGNVTYTPDANYNSTIGGADTFTYTVSTDDGAGGTITETATVTVTIIAVNDDPDAVGNAYVGAEDVAISGNLISDDTSGTAGSEAGVDSDVDNVAAALNITSFTVAGTTGTNMDGSWPAGASANLPGTGSLTINGDGSFTLTPAANFNGAFPAVTYTLSDGAGGSDTAPVVFTFTPVNDDPTASGVDPTTAEDTAVSSSITLADPDLPGGPDVLSASLDSGPGSAPNNGSVVVNSDGSYTYTPDPDFNGIDTFTVLVEDGQGGSTTHVVTVTVTPVDDVVSHILPLAQTAVEDTALSIGGVSVVDVDGDTITTIVTIPGANGTLSVATGTGATLSGNNSDSIILTGTAAQINGALAGLTYAPSADFNTDAAGPFNMSILSDDGGGGGPTFNTLAINVSGVADIVADSVTTDEDTAITFDAIGGTNGANGDNFEDVAAAVSAVSTASNGSVSINGFGEIVYTPDADFNGSDSFTYTVSAGGVSETALVTVTIDPVNDAPDLMADTASGAEDGGAINGNVLTNDSDIDVGDTLTVTQFAIVGIAGPHMANDTVNLPGVGTITLNDDGSFAFLPAADYNGTVPQITYTATDGTAPLSSTLDITVTPVNDNPVAAADSNSTDEDTPLSVNAASGVLSNDNDGDGAAPGVGLSVTQFTVDGMSYVAGNTANLAEGNLTLNPDGSYDFTPAANYNGAVPQITYTVTDVGGPGAGGAGGPLTHTATLDLTVNPINDAPDVTGPAGTVDATEDSGLFFTVAGGNGIVIGDVDTLVTDPGTTSVTLSVDHGTLLVAAGSGASVSDDGTKTVVIGGTLAQINAALDGLRYRGVDDYFGGDLISIDVDDGSATANATTSGSVMVNVQAVVDVEDDGVSTDEDTAVGFNVLTGFTLGDPDGATADDFESSSPRLAAIGTGADAPQNGTVSISDDGSVVYTPDANFNGLDSFTYMIETPDGDGGFVTETGTVTVTVNAINDGPEHTVPDTSGGPLASTTTTEDGSITFAAANGNGLSVADVDGPGLTTTLSVTHGTLAVAAGSGASVSDDGTGTVTLSGTSAQINAALEGLVYTPLDDFNTGGSQSEQLVMSTNDGSGAANAIVSDTIDIAVTAIGDVASDSISTNEDTAASFNVLTGLGGASADNFEDAGRVVTSVTQGTHGSVGFDGAGNVTYTPDANYNSTIGGADTFTYTVSTDDGAGGTITETATVTVTIIAVNDDPDAVGNAYVGAEDVAISGNLISDDTSGTAGSEAGVDSDVDNVAAALNITSFTVAGTTGTNMDGSWPAGASANLPGTGSLTINGDGSFTLTPAANFNGAFPAVTYTLSDGAGGSDTAPVVFTFTPVNDDPTASGVDPTTAEDTAVSSSITLADPDLPGGPDVLSASLDSGPGSAPNNGSVVVNSDGSYTYTPDPDFNGIDTFTVLVEDGQGGSTTHVVTVTVTPVDDVVSHILPLAQTAVEDTALSIGGVSVVDVDGDTITTIVTIPGANGTLSVATGTGATLSGNNSDSIILTGTAAQINGALAGLTYAPSADFNTDAAGPFNMSILSDDGGGGGPTFNTLAINVSGVADIVADSVTTDEDTAITFDAIGGTNGANGDNFEDVAAAVSAVSTASNGSVSINGFGEIVYTPDADFNGSDSFTYTVSAGGVSETALVTVTIDPVNDAPDLMADTASGAEDGGAINGNVLTNDSDIDVGDTLTVTQFAIVGIAGPHMANDTVNLPGVGTITLNDDGSFAFLPAADYNGTVPQITYTATDGTAPLSSTLDITVTPVNDNPVAAADSNSTDEDTPLSVNAASGVLSNDNDGDGAAPGVGLSVTQFTVDGMSYVAGNTANLAEGNLTLNPDGSYDFTPAANYNGAVPQITYTVTDVGGPGAGGAGGPLTHTATLDLTVNPINDAPDVTGPAGTVDATEDSGLFFTVAGGNGIVIGDVDTLVTDPGTTSVTLSVDHGTLLVAAGSGASVSDDGTKTVVIGGTLAQINAALDGLRYRGVDDYFGGDLISIDVDDGSATANATTSGSVMVNVQAVVDVEDDGVSTDEDTAVGFNVLTGFTLGDPDGATADDFESSSPRLAAIGTGADAPQNGTVSISDDGSVVYTPDANFNGLDSFTYMIETPDGDGGFVTETGTVTVTVNAINDGPEHTVPDTSGGPLASTTTTEDGSITFAAANGNGLSVADVDGPGLTTTLSVTHGTLAVAAGSGASVSDDGTGTVTLSGTSAQINAALEGLVYTPLDDFNTGGSQSEQLVMSTNDGSGAANAIVSDTIDIAVTAIGDVASDSISTNEDTAASFNVLTGLGGASADNFEDAGRVVTSVTQGTHGSVGFDGAGNVTYTPDANYNSTIGGADTFTYTVSTDDGAGGTITETATVTVTIIAVNDDPDAVGNAYVGAEDVAISGNLISDDTSGTAGSEAGVDSDVDNVAAALNITSFTVAGTTGTNMDGSWPAGASANLPGTGSLTINGDGSFTLTPAANFNGAFPAVTYTLSDGAGGSDTAPVVFTFTPVNDDPTASGVDPTTAEDTAVSSSITLADPDLPGGPDVLSASLDSGPGSAPNNGSVVVNSDGSYTYTPDPDFNGIDTFTVLVEDGQGGSTTHVVTVTVTPVDDVVSHILPLAQTAVEDTALSIGGVSVVDVDGDTITTIVTIPGANGTLSVATGTGATLSGNNSDSIILTGTAAQINGALAGLTYAPSADFNTDAAGPFNMSILSDDGGGGGPTFNTLAINVSGVADIVADSVTTDEDTAITFDAIGGTNGANGDNFEDVAAAVSAVSTASNGSVSINGFGEIVYTPDADFNGSDSFTYTVSAGGVSETALVTVTIDPVNDAPDLMADTASGAEDGGAINGNVLTNDSDIDVGDTLTVTQFAIVGIAGPHMANDTVNLPGVGTITLNDDGSFAFLPAADYNGTVPQITYTATDGTAPLSSTLDITVTPVNDNPVAAADSNSTDEDTPLSVNAASGVLSNDNDGDGAAPGVGLSVTQFTVDGMSYVAGNTANLAEGNLTLNPDGSYDFTPAANYNGAVPQITYTVTDVGGPGAGGAGGPLTHTATLDLTVNPINDAPDAKDDVYTVAEDSLVAVSGNLILDDGGAGIDSDVDGDPLLITAAVVDVDGNGSLDPITLGAPTVIRDNLANPIGTLTLDATGLFSFVPGADFFGTVPPISYTVDDGSGEMNSSDVGLLSVVVTPVNDAPDSTADNVTGNEDEIIGLNPTLPVDVDDAQSALTAVVTQVPQLSQGILTYTQDGGGTGTVLNGQPLSMTELASVSFRSFPNYNGPVDDFIYRAIDDEGATDAGSIGRVAIALVAVNDAPSAQDDGPISVTEDVAVSGNVLGNDTDIDGDTITVSDFTVAGVPGPIVAGSMATISGVGTLVVESDGDFTFTPTLNYNGPVPAVSYTITDSNGGSDSANLTFADVTPVNDDPDATAGSYTTPEDVQLIGNLLLDDTGAGLDFDVDGDAIAVSGFSLAGEPGPFVVGTAYSIVGVGSLTIQTNGNFTFDPATDYNGPVPQLTYVISDGQGGASSAVVSILVDPVNDAPTATTPLINTLEDQAVGGLVDIHDIDGDDPVAVLDAGATNGTALVNPDGSWTYTPFADFNGTDQFDVLVDDLNGGTVTVTVIVNISPVADIADDQLSTPEDVSVTVNVVTGSGTVGGPGGVGSDSFEGATLVTAVTQGSHGSVVFNAAGDVTYLPDPNYNGPDSFTYTVLSGGVTETATVAVNVVSVNDVPVGTSVPATTLEDTPVSGAITMTDPDGDVLTASRGLTPDHGTVTVNPDGSWTYSPNLNFEGFDTFTVVVDDGHGGTTNVLVEVTVVAVNDAPDVVSSFLTTIADEPTELNLTLPSDVDDVASVLSSQIVQLPDPLQTSLTYLPGGVPGTPVLLSVGLVLSNDELATVVFTAQPGVLGSVGSLIYRTSDDDGASDAGSLASIDIEVAAAPVNALVAETPLDLPEKDKVEGQETEDPVMPFVVDAVNEIADLGSVGDLNPEQGIVRDAVEKVNSLGSTETILPVDPAVLDAVQAINALREVHRQNVGSSEEIRSISENEWSIESLTGFSLKFSHDDRQEEEQSAYSDAGQLVIETYVRERILFIDVSNTFDPDVEGVVDSYRVEMADDSKLPDWIRIVRDGFIVAERPANLWDLNLKISAVMEDGSLITRGVLIDGPTGEIQPLDLEGQEDGKRFEDKLRLLVQN